MYGISAVLQAAGLSSRMGTSKPLLMWHGVPLVKYQVDSLIAGGVDEVVVVLGHDAENVALHVAEPKAISTINGDYKSGKTTSIKAGLRAMEFINNSILLLAVDQPRTTGLIETVIDAHKSEKPLITSPRYQNHGGHPLIFDSLLREELLNITEENEGIRAIFERHRDSVLDVQVDDPIIRLDLNTPENYEFAKNLYKA